MIPLYGDCLVRIVSLADLAQLGERQTEDLKVPGSIPGLGIHVDVWHVQYVGKVHVSW